MLDSSLHPLALSVRVRGIGVPSDEMINLAHCFSSYKTCSLDTFSALRALYLFTVPK